MSQISFSYATCNTPAKRNCSCGKARKRIALSPQTPPNFTKKPCSGIVNLREFLILIPGEAVKVNKKSAHAQLAQMQRITFICKADSVMKFGRLVSTLGMSIWGTDTIQLASLYLV